MPFSHLNLITVTGKYLLLNGNAAVGTVTFEPSTVLLDTVGNEVIFPSITTVTLALDGTFTISLPATDDPDIGPTNWSYVVTERIIGATTTRTFNMLVPYNSPGGTLDMADVQPAVTGTPSVTYVLTTTFNSHVADTTKHLVLGTGSGQAYPGDSGATNAANIATNATAITNEASTARTNEGLKLVKASNLSDVNNAATALANLGGQTTIPPGTYVKSAIVTATDATTVTFDLTAGNKQRVTLGGNRTLAVSGDTANPSFMVTLNTGAGAFLVTWWAGIVWASGSVPTLTATANKEDTFAFVRRGAGDYVGRIVDQGVAGPPTVPGAPTSVVGTPGNTSASIAFTPPASNGGSAITGYTATLTPGGATFSGATSPIAATGLTNGTAYTATVHATNAVGNSSESSASTPFTPNVGALVSDAFTRANGIINGSTSDTGQPWSGPSDWEVNGNQVRIVTVANSAIFINAGQPNQAVSLTIPVLPATFGAGVVARSDSTSFYYAQVNTNGSVTLAKKVTGSFTILGTSAAGACVAGDTIGLVITGTSLSATINGAPVVGPLADSSLASGNMAGMWSNSTNSVFRGDTFQVFAA